ncbi:hypothetical protein DBV15_04955 [Temnothorax longispinosus]|uniref:Uncharacterized protein n=1 Tax=Temnothorax longispinosus TaxID=300112 RepID=A0A4S2KUN8_9HYME|nr:hypothetical protein DBV15_04955 [Temnothorax longispinosus]
MESIMTYITRATVHRSRNEQLVNQSIRFTHAHASGDAYLPDDHVTREKGKTICARQKSNRKQGLGEEMGWIKKRRFRVLSSVVRAVTRTRKGREKEEGRKGKRSIACESRKLARAAELKIRISGVSGIERRRRRRRCCRVVVSFFSLRVVIRVKCMPRRDAPNHLATVATPRTRIVIRSFVHSTFRRSCLRLGRESRSLFGRGTHGSPARSLSALVSSPTFPLPSSCNAIPITFAAPSSSASRCSSSSLDLAIAFIAEKSYGDRLKIEWHDGGIPMRQVTKAGKEWSEQTSDDGALTREKRAQRSSTVAALSLVASCSSCCFNKAARVHEPTKINRALQIAIAAYVGFELFRQAKSAISDTSVGQKSVRNHQKTRGPLPTSFDATSKQMPGRISATALGIISTSVHRAIILSSAAELWVQPVVNVEERTCLYHPGIDGKEKEKVNLFCLRLKSCQVGRTDKFTTGAIWVSKFNSAHKKARRAREENRREKERRQEYVGSVERRKRPRPSAAERRGGFIVRTIVRNARAPI